LNIHADVLYRVMRLVYKERPQQDEPSFNMLLLIHISLTTYQPYGVNFGLNTLINVNLGIGYDKVLLFYVW